MNQSPTPGQIAYEAYCALPGARYCDPWAELSGWAQQRWEAAAQAVLAQGTEEKTDV
jgi:hypothetical protein